MALIKNFFNTIEDFARTYPLSTIILYDAAKNYLSFSTARNVLENALALSFLNLSEILKQIPFF